MYSGIHPRSTTHVLPQPIPFQLPSLSIHQIGECNELTSFLQVTAATIAAAAINRSQGDSDSHSSSSNEMEAPDPNTLKVRTTLTLTRSILSIHICHHPPPNTLLLILPTDPHQRAASNTPHTPSNTCYRLSPKSSIEGPWTRPLARQITTPLTPHKYTPDHPSKDAKSNPNSNSIKCKSINQTVLSSNSNSLLLFSHSCFSENEVDLKV